MKAKRLSETNPYLKNIAERKKLVSRSVRTSCGVEGINPPTKASQPFNIFQRKDKKIYKR
jgi:hypothetical protein